MRARLIQCGALLLAVALVYSATRYSPQINAGRRQLDVFGAQDVSKSTPPQYAFAIQALGAFRSLIVNIAFIRAETLKEEGRYYDAMQLASWICQFQPRFPTVWEFHAWNMAWNISVTTFTAEERWNWVYNGVKLLRDQGIPLNPRAINLYKELAWIFNDKMGGMMDDFHWAYKREWAWQMHLVLGPRPQPLQAKSGSGQPPNALIDVTDDTLAEVARRIAQENEATRQKRMAEEKLPYRTSKPIESILTRAAKDAAAERTSTPAELATRAVYDMIKSIDDAPRSLDALYAQYPETREMVAQLRDIGVVISDDKLTEDDYWYDGKLAANFFARYRQIADAPGVRTEILRGGNAAPQDEGVRRLDEIMGVRAGNRAGQALLRFLQRKVLTEVYRLDPAHMAYVVENFGPIDWRTVDSQSLYWVTLGLIRGGETVTSFQTDKVNTARLIFFSLRNLFHGNKLVFEPDPEDPFNSYWNASIDVDFVEPMHRAFITYGPMIDPDPGNAGGAGSMFRTGHINFLAGAVRALYFSDRLDEAEHYYEYLRTHYGRMVDGSVDQQYTLPLRDFVLKTMYPTIETMRETENVIRSLLWQAYDKLADGDAVAYNQFVKKALEFHDVYQKEKEAYRTGRVTLLPFSDYQVDTFHAYFSIPGTQEEMMLRKVHLWWAAPLTLRQSVYDELIPQLARECRAWNFDSTKAFPEPEGMEQFRKDHPRRQGGHEPGEKAEQPTGVETPAQAP
jgi:hypothetical protein